MGMAGSYCQSLWLKAVNVWRGLSYRHLVLLMGFFLNLAAGTQYNFSAYSPALRDALDYTQSETTLVATLGNIGLYCGFLIGIIYDRTGPRWTSLIAGIMVFTGYLLTWLSLRGDIPGDAWLVAIFYIFVGQGSWGLYEVALLTNIKNFQKNIGKVTGLMAAAFGLSSGLFTLIYSGFYSADDNVEGFVLLMAICVAVAATLAVAIMKIVPEDEISSTLTDDERAEEQPIVHSNENPVDAQEQKAPQPGVEDVTGLKLFKQVDFWLLWVSFLIAAGAGLMVINHLGEIVLSTRGSKTEKNILVGLLSLSNCSGRILVGFFSDRTSHLLNRAYWFVFGLILLGGTHLSFAVMTRDWWVGFLTMFTGISYGGIFAVIPVLVSLYFGFKNLGVNFGFIALAPACGSLAFGQLAGFLYDHEAEKQKNEDGGDGGDGDEDDGERCYGPSCYNLAFMITGIMCFVAVITAFTLAVRRGQRTLREIFPCFVRFLPWKVEYHE